MSLSAREQHALDCIAGELGGSDPKLAALLATFTRLTSGEEMPAGEGMRRARRGTRRVRQARLRARPACERAFFQPTVPRALAWLLAAALVVMLIAVVAALTSGKSREACTNSWASWAAACVSPVPAHSSRSAPKTTADPMLYLVQPVPAVNPLAA